MERPDDDIPGLIDVLRHTPHEHRALIRAVAAAVQELGLDKLLERLTEAPEIAGTVLRPYAVGRDSLAGHMDINVIPAPPGQPGVCTQTVLALAHGTRPPTGWAMVLRLLRAHLVTCGVGPRGLTGRTAILVTDTFIRRAWYESSRDVFEHMRQAGLTFVGMHWNGRRWVFFEP